MALDRVLPTSASTPPVTGPNYMDAVQEEVTGLWDRSICRLTSVAGTNTITASVVPAMTAGYVNQMRFILIPVNTTSSTSVTLNIDSAGAKTILDNKGAALVSGALVAGAMYMLEYNSTANAFYCLTYLPASAFDDRPSFRNIASANGACDVWQRGSPVDVPASSSTGVYTVDRFYLITSTGQHSNVVRTPASGVAGYGRSRYAAVIQRLAGESGTTQMQFSYPLTTEEVARLIGAKCTLSMVLGIGANWSPTSGTLNYAFVVGTGAEGKSAGFTSPTNVISGSVNLVGVTSISATSAANVPSTATQGEIKFTWTPVGTAGAQDWWILDNLQLESGTIATEFEYMPFDLMLKECERHYCKTFPYDTAPVTNGGVAGALSAIAIGDETLNRAVNVLWQFRTPMRTSPTITTYNPSAANANWRNITGAIDWAGAVSVNPSSVASAERAFITAGTGGSTGATGHHVAIHAAASADL